MLACVSSLNTQHHAVRVSGPHHTRSVHLTEACPKVVCTSLYILSSYAEESSSSLQSLLQLIVQVKPHSFHAGASSNVD